MPSQKVSKPLPSSFLRYFRKDNAAVLKTPQSELGQKLNPLIGNDAKWTHFLKKIGSI